MGEATLLACSLCHRPGVVHEESNQQQDQSQEMILILRVLELKSNCD